MKLQLLYDHMYSVTTPTKCFSNMTATALMSQESTPNVIFCYMLYLSLSDFFIHDLNIAHPVNMRGLVFYSHLTDVGGLDPEIVQTRHF